MLNELGLVPALRYLSEGLAQRSQLKISIEDVPEPRLPRRVETTLYHIAKEALHNVVKHARATRATIEFRRTPEPIYCSIRDDGRGFDPIGRRDRQAQGFGLIGIRERLSVVGGHLQINSQPGAGTELIISIPVETEMPIRVVLADDHLIVRQGLRLVLEKEQIEVLGEAADGLRRCA